MWKALLSSLLTLGSMSLAASQTVDNGLTGDPEITCGDTGIAISVSTRRPYAGNLFVSDRVADPHCRSTGNNTVHGAELHLPFKSCGLGRRRSVDPKGIFVTTMVVLSFHDQFITKEDKVYMIQCYYMESEKIVMTEITVAMLTTSFQTAIVPMPVCRYEVLSGGPSGPAIRYAQIGDKVYHKWTCDSDTVDTFCMIVHSCNVNDGEDDTVNLLDHNGCSHDPHLLDNLDYLTDLMAGKEAHVFKYADRNRLFFDCQIAISVKEPNIPCPRPVNCDQPVRRRGRRSVPLLEGPKAEQGEPRAPDGICMGSGGLGLYAAANAALLLLSLGLLLGACREARDASSSSHFVDVARLQPGPYFF